MPNKQFDLDKRTARIDIQESFDGKSDRHWYTFNGIRQINNHNKVILIGQGEWPGFGMDTARGTNGEPFVIGNNNCLEFDMSGLTQGEVHVELTDFNGVVETISFTVSAHQAQQKLLLNKVKDKITKLQFIFPSGEVNCSLSRIGFSKADKELSLVFVPSLAFDIGLSSVKMALLDNHHNPLLLEQESIQANSATSTEDWLTAAVNTIRSMIAKHKLKPQKLCFVISRSASTYRHTVLSSYDKKLPLDNTLTRELMLSGTITSRENNLSFWVNDKERNDYFVLITPTATTELYRDLSKKTGFSNALAVENCIALCQLHTALYPNASGVTAILDQAPELATVLILNKNKLLFVRQFKIPKDQASQAELTRTFEYFSNENPQLAIQKILVCGENIPSGSLEQLSAQTGLSTFLLFDTKQIENQAFADWPNTIPEISKFAAVLGMAVTGHPENASYDLLRSSAEKTISKTAQPDIKQPVVQMKSWLRKLTSSIPGQVTGLILLLLMILLILLRVQTSHLQKELSSKTSYLSRIESQAVSANELITGLRQSELLLSQLSGQVKKNRVLQTILPLPNGLTITALEYNALTDQLNLVGTAKAEEVLQAYASQLSRKKGIKQVESAPAQTVGMDILFQLRIILTGV